MNPHDEDEPEEQPAGVDDDRPDPVERSGTSDHTATDPVERAAPAGSGSDDRPAADPASPESGGDAEPPGSAETPGDREPSDSAETPAERGPDEVYCSSCGEVIKQEAEICPHCGVRQQSSSTNIGGEPGNLDPALAGVASFLLPGLGQAYNGQVPRGIAVFLAVMMADFIIITISFILTFLVIGIFGFLLVPVVHALAAADAYSQAGKINRGEVSVA